MGFSIAPFYLGDRVETLDGDGYVEASTSFRTLLGGFNEEEALIFTARCKLVYGDDYAETYAEVLVRFDSGKTGWYMNKDVDIVKSRGGHER